MNRIFTFTICVALSLCVARSAQAGKPCAGYNGGTPTGFDVICEDADTCINVNENGTRKGFCLTPGYRCTESSQICNCSGISPGFMCPSDKECYKKDSSTWGCKVPSTAESLSADMPSFINPIDKMQIKIPGMVAGTPVCTGSMTDKNQVCKFPWIGNYIQGLYTYGLGIAGILATIVMMFGGVLWLTSQGNSQQVGEAKAWIGGATTGLLLLFCTFLIMNTVNPELTTLKPITLGMIAEEEGLNGADATESDTESASKDCGGVSMIWPSSNHTITSPFYRLKTTVDKKTGKELWKAGTKHGGCDIPLAQGSPVNAATDGTVTMARENNSSIDPCSMVIIQKGNIETRYIHLSKVQVTNGQTVTRGQVIGLSGGAKGSNGSCRTTGAHLHFQIRNGKDLVNPKYCLPGYSAAN